MSDENKFTDSAHERLCAFLFGELDVDERAAFESELEQSQALQAELERMQSTVELVRSVGSIEEAPEERLSEESIGKMIEARGVAPVRRFQLLRSGGISRMTRIAAGLVLFLGAGLVLRNYILPPLMPTESQEPLAHRAFGDVEVASVDAPPTPEVLEGLEGLGYVGDRDLAARKARSRGKKADKLGVAQKELNALGYGAGGRGPASPGPSSAAPSKTAASNTSAPQQLVRQRARSKAPRTIPLAGVTGTPAADPAPEAESKSKREEPERALRALGYVGEALDSDDYDGGAVPADEETPSVLPHLTERLILGCRVLPDETPRGMFFRCWGEHPFVSVTREDHLSTFSVDVDTSSYVQSRHALLAGRLPAAGSVRTEEFVNYFHADQEAPVGGDTFAIGLEMAPSRFGSDARTNLLRVTVRGKDVEDYERQPLALTFVVDVSGSMRDQSRLENVKAALSLLVRKLDAGDSIAMVAFNNEARLIAPMNSAASRGSLEDGLYTLQPSGGTSVESGLNLGFQTAADNLVVGAVNRVIFLSDGVGNIDGTDQERILASVESFRDGNIYLNTIGVGLDSHNDHFLEQLADRGDGVCNYIDSLDEVKRVMVDDFTKTLQPIARDVKIQLDFDPNEVESFRQIGYENRALRDDQFRDDTVDAGEVNAGHQVTALYEIVPRVGSTGAFITARVRYKPPFAVDRGQTSLRSAEQAEVALEIEASLRWDQLVPTYEAASWGYRRATLVAQFAELMRHSIHARGERVDDLIRELERLCGQRRDDAELDELLGLVRQARPGLQKIEKAYRSRPAWQGSVDELRRLNYRAAQRELLGAGDEESAARNAAQMKALESRLREILAGSAAADRAALESQINGYLGQGGDVQPETLDALRAMGYTGVDTPALDLNPKDHRPRR